MSVPFKYNARNLRVRWTATLMTASGVFLVVMVVIGVTAVLEGIGRSLKSTGSSDNILVLGKSQTTEAFGGQSREILGTLRAIDAIKLNARGEKMVSEEFAMSLRPLKPGGGMPFWQLRGITSMAPEVHDVVRLQPGGKWPEGAGELSFGAGVVRSHGYRLGDPVKISNKDYRIVGVFDAGGSALENEIWMDINILRAEFHKNYLTSVLLKLQSPAMVRAQVQMLTDGTLISVKAWPEREYYATQNMFAGPLKRAGTLMALLLGIGAVFGGMNTMFTAVAARRREIGTLRALGFSRAAILASFILESMLIALLGFLLAAAVECALTFVRVANSGGFRGTGFTLGISGGGWLLALGVALGMGLLGGLLPSLMAARMKLVDALRSS